MMVQQSEDAVTDSECDYDQHHEPVVVVSSRQKDFLRRFKDVPRNELVLEKYSCALSSDILLQGHLYITKSYFAFYSNVFTHVTKLLIPIESVTKITKENIALIIPNAIGVATEEGEKCHIFASLLFRDSTFKAMKKLWEKVMQEKQQQQQQQGTSTASLISQDNNPASTDAELASEDLTSDSDCSADDDEKPVNIHIKHTEEPVNPSTTTSLQPDPKGHTTVNHTRLKANLLRRIFDCATNSTVLAVLVISLLMVLFCASVYLVIRIDSIQNQVVSKYAGRDRFLQKWSMDFQTSNDMMQVLDSNVNQISMVRKSFEKINNMVRNSNKQYHKNWKHELD